MKKIFKIGTRASDLAIKQSRLVIDKLRLNFPETSFIVVPMDTTGDIRREKNKSVEDKKQWIIELEHKLCNSKIDLAIHSGKDVPIQLEPGTLVTSVLKRAESSDIMLYNSSSAETHGFSFPMLKPGAIVGTSSKRRKSQLLRLRPDLEIRLCRGHVPTRISKLRVKKEFDAIILASAGLSRLDLKDDSNSYIFSVEEMLPAVGQGTLVAQYCRDANEVKEMLDTIVDSETQQTFHSERACIDKLGADCHSSVGVFAEIIDNELLIKGRVLSENGLEYVEGELRGDKNKASEIGGQLGNILLEKGACSLL